MQGIEKGAKETTEGISTNSTISKEEEKRTTKRTPPKPHDGKRYC
jgi:hypothetical protein